MRTFIILILIHINIIIFTISLLTTVQGCCFCCSGNIMKLWYIVVKLSCKIIISPADRLLDIVFIFTPALCRFYCRGCIGRISSKIMRETQVQKSFKANFLFLIVIHSLEWSIISNLIYSFLSNIFWQPKFARLNLNK